MDFWTFVIWNEQKVLKFYVLSHKRFISLSVKPMTFLFARAQNNKKSKVRWHWQKKRTLFKSEVLNNNLRYAKL